MDHLDQSGLSVYIPTWFQQIVNSSSSSYREIYREPVVEDYTVIFIKQACTVLKQDVHVFVSSVEILENYLNIKTGKEERVADITLAAICSVFLCSKYAGGQSDLRATQIEEFMYKLHRKKYSTTIIKSQEFDIFRTFNGNITVHTLIDDLNILLEHYVTSMNLRADLRDLCTGILKFYYVYRKRIFTKLKTIYQRNNIHEFYAFAQCVCKRLYFPSGIVLCGFKITKCKNFLDLNKITKELGEIIFIHEDHLRILSDVIYELLTKGNPQN